MDNFDYDYHTEEEYYNGIDTIDEDKILEHKLVCDKYLPIIYEYQELIGDMRIEGEYGEHDSIYDDIDNIEDVINDWTEDDFINYIEYLKKVSGK